MDTKKLGPVIGVVVILLVVVVMLRGKDGALNPDASPTPTASPSVSVSPTATPKPAATAKPAAIPTNYGAAVVQYADRRIQFDMYCQANPVNNTYKNGTSIMLDNRSGDARTIVVNGVHYALAGYGWKIITLSAKSIPATWAVDCGAARNVSKILLQ
jgi:hypothetical protein